MLHQTVKVLKPGGTAFVIGISETDWVSFNIDDHRSAPIAKLAVGLACEQTIMPIARQVGRKRLEHYSHVRMEAKCAALNALAQDGNPVAGVHSQAHNQP